MFEDFIIEAVDRVLSWDISDEALSQAVIAQAALLSHSDQHCMVLDQ
jgi:hypothetical protein